MKYGTDYSKTAIDLKNPDEVRELLLAYSRANEAAIAAEIAYREATNLLPEGVALVDANRIAAEAAAAVKESVKRAGGYQDITEGHYALMQSRTGVNYSASKVRTELPQFADAVINETVDGAKIHGLVKGGLIDEAQLARIEVLTNLSPAFILGLATKPTAKEGTNAD